MKPIPSYVHNPLVLDEDNVVAFHTWKGDTEPYGALWCHTDKRNPERWCIGGFDWRLPEGYPRQEQATWDLVSLDPLTVSPSLHCLSCGAHGFIRDGKWIPA